MLQWRIGDVTITRILEMEGYGDIASLLPDATAAGICQIPWLTPHFANDEGHTRSSLHSLIVETPTHRIMVDTCYGNDKQRQLEMFSNLKTDFLRNIETAGYERHMISTVLCTHLHVDHVGWNTMLIDGAWRPTFPNARYLFARAEYEYWSAHEENITDRAVFADSVLPVMEAGLVDLVEPDHRICEEVRLIPTPGHSPGHVSVLVSSRGKRALITGDFMHHPCQCAHPEWSSHFDTDADVARNTRRTMLAMLADTPIVVIGTHFPSPTAGQVVSDGGTYRFEV